MSRRSRFLVGGAVVVGALVWLLGAGLGNSLVYYLTPSELLAEGAQAYERPLRLSGQVEPGSIEWNAESGELRFRVRDDSSAVAVLSTGIPPEMFQDGIDVVLEGSLSRTGVFLASTLMVKHSNEYGPGQEGTPAAERFRGLQGGSTTPENTP